MGQAKLRGTTQERITNAIKIKKAQIPTKIECNNCGTEIFEIKSLDSRSLIGITGVYAGHCPNCKCQTIGMIGNPERVNYYMEHYAKFSGLTETEIFLQKNIGTNKFSRV